MFILPPGQEALQECFKKNIMFSSEEIVVLVKTIIGFSTRQCKNFYCMLFRLEIKGNKPDLMVEL